MLPADPAKARCSDFLTVYKKQQGARVGGWEERPGCLVHGPGKNFHLGYELETF